MVIASFTLITVFTSIASPSLEDSYITYSLKAYYTNFEITYNRVTGLLDSSGVISSNPDYRTYTYFDVYPGGTVFMFNTVSNNTPKNFTALCFYDSNYKNKEQ